LAGNGSALIGSGDIRLRVLLQRKLTALATARKEKQPTAPLSDRRDYR
jgi:hypothetical protein